MEALGVCSNVSGYCLLLWVKCRKASSLLKNCEDRRVRARGLHDFQRNRGLCRPGALTGWVFQQSASCAADYLDLWWIPSFAFFPVGNAHRYDGPHFAGHTASAKTWRRFRKPPAKAVHLAWIRALECLQAKRSDDGAFPTHENVTPGRESLRRRKAVSRWNGVSVPPSASIQADHKRHSVRL